MYGATMAEVHQQSFISKLHFSLSNGMPHAEPLPSLKSDEKELVHGILQMLQGFSSCLFSWDEKEQKFSAKNGVFTTHLSRTSLDSILNKFIFCGTSLKKVELFVNKVKASSQRAPTLKAFANSVHLWLNILRDLALKEEIKSTSLNFHMTITLLQLTNSLSSMCSAAERLIQVVLGSIPDTYFNTKTVIPANRLTISILDSLFMKLNEVYLVQGGEEEAYHMLLSIMGESLLPYLEVLDLWLYEGFLDDPCEEVFFYANNDITIDQPAYWETSYLPRPICLKPSYTYADSGESASLRLGIEIGARHQSDTACPIFLKDLAGHIVSAGKSLQLIQHARIDRSALSSQNHDRLLGVLTLSEIFLVSLVGLVADGEHIFHKLTMISLENMKTSFSNEKNWVNFITSICCHEEISLYTPIMAVYRELIEKHNAALSDISISRCISLPPLNDENLRRAIYAENGGSNHIFYGTDYTSGFQCSEVQQFHEEDDVRTLECLYSFPTLLPTFQEDDSVTDILPFQKNTTLSLRILSWIRKTRPNAAHHPDVIMKECLAMCIKKQTDQIGRQILLKLMTDWKLMEELNILRSIYLLGSGDLLQRFLTVLFDRINRAESWDDDFELNTILQESIRNSADSSLLSTPDSLVISISQSDDFEEDEHKASLRARGQFFGIDALDLLKFSYKVSWPLDLIINAEALKKYNQVMGFLLKVKRAKYLLDKARRWMWKGKLAEQNLKHHMLVEQKLLHFVDAFHQCVMDRVFHSAWIELCTAMSSAGSLDEVIEVHEVYLSSIQRQCFVGPDKLWALIATRVKNILVLAIDFHSVQQTLHSGGASSSIKARCELEVDRIEKQFDDCVAFLIRISSFKLNVGHFPHFADLITRINYNYFYMSDSGNLLTAPSFDGAKLAFLS